MRRVPVAAVLALVLAGFGAAGACAAGPAVAATQAVAPDFRGIGPLHFGMTDAQMRKAWGKPLYGGALPGNPNGAACHYLLPRKDGKALTFMMVDGHFARVDVLAGGALAPGGGHIGMRIDALRTLYAGRIKATPNKYDDAATDLRVTPPAGESGLLLFEADKTGKVTAWRIGKAEQVDYVEGCS